MYFSRMYPMTPDPDAPIKCGCMVCGFVSSAASAHASVEALNEHARYVHADIVRPVGE